MANLLTNNRDFLFLFEAAQCNPNGDPDQENRPRMDYDTQINLVTDVRIKRYIRDFLKQQGNEIFVDMESEAKVTMDERMKRIVHALFEDEGRMMALIDDPEIREQYLKIKREGGAAVENILVTDKTKHKAFNMALLSALVKERFIDIRMFGSAFAVKGFNRAMTGPIQLNWGYSLNQVFLMESNTISSIMNDDSSTFGKDYRVKYALIAFQGTINKHAAATTGLTEQDIDTFRNAIWQSLTASPTRSKLNQYPKLYLEVIYNEGYHNGYFGDLRQLLSAPVRDEKDPRTVRQFSDLSLDLSKLKSRLADETGPGKAVKEVHVRASHDLIY